jgi:hypothetical protein
MLCLSTFRATTNKYISHQRRGGEERSKDHWSKTKVSLYTINKESCSSEMLFQNLRFKSIYFLCNIACIKIFISDCSLSFNCTIYISTSTLEVCKSARYQKIVCPTDSTAPIKFDIHQRSIRSYLLQLQLSLIFNHYFPAYPYSRCIIFSSTKKLHKLYSCIKCIRSP